MEIFVPDGSDQQQALARTTHLAISAHQDDIELMAYHGIQACYGLRDKWFTGVVVTDGAGSPRSGLYGSYTDEEMKAVRVTEQKNAAIVGGYSAQLFLGCPSSAVKDPDRTDIVDQLADIIDQTQPEVVYLHNLADKHATHIGVAVKAIMALRKCAHKPKAVYGCEVWRGLDWMLDSEKVLLDVSGHPNLENAVLSVFDSQIAGGKRYDLAAVGRRVANATYFESHGVDDSNSLCYAMDLTPLITDVSLDLAQYTTAYIDRFKQDVIQKIDSMQ